MFVWGEELNEIVEKINVNEEDWTIFENLPQPSIKPNPKNKEWIKEFSSYIRELVSRITPPGREELVDIIVNDETIKNVWLNVFTSIYVNYNKGENYEAYEAVGDSFLKYVFYIYLYERFAPDIDRDHLNDLKTTYLSKPWQAVAGEKMGLNNWVLVPEELRDHPGIKEDMQEAFCGAIDIILNKSNIEQGSSKIMILYMFERLFDKVRFDLSVKMTPKETQLEQWYGGIADMKKEEKIIVKKPNSIDRKIWKNIIKGLDNVLKKNDISLAISENPGTHEIGVHYESKVNPDGSAVFKVYLNDKGYEALAKKGIKVENRLLAEEKSGTLTQAKTNARVKAMEVLEDLGVTQEWIEDQKIYKKEKGLNHLEEALKKAKHELGEKVVNVYPSKVKQIKKDKIFQLFAEFKNGKKKILETIIIPVGINKDSINVYQFLIDKYLS